MRKGWIAIAATIALLAVLWIAQIPVAPLLLAQSDVKSVNDQAYFFRLTAKYMHGDEPVDFDIVVGCGVRVTTYEFDSPSYDAFRDPLFHVKPTEDGNAVLQIVPDACQGQTTDNGRVPADFLPGAIWFDSKNDFSFGVAYIAEDAFENPAAKLKFLGATIHPATKEEWQAYRPINAQNLLSPKWFSHSVPIPPVEEIREHLWNRKKLFEWRPFFVCRGVMRYRVSEPVAREYIRQMWPAAQPRFWMPNSGELESLVSRLDSINGGRGPLLDGHYRREYFTMYETSGFATLAGGGKFRARGIASKIYPLRADDGFHWATPGLAKAETIYRDVDLMAGTNAGYAYCFNYFRVGLITEVHLPDYFHRQFRMRVDGVVIETDYSGPDIPSPFFEKDEYIYYSFDFGLS